jgi:hypothetical protein
MTPPLWPDLAAFLQQLDTLTSPSAAAAVLRTLRAQLGAAEQEDSFNEVEGKLSFQCSDTANPDDIGVWVRAADVADRQFPYFGGIWTRCPASANVADPRRRSLHRPVYRPDGHALGQGAAGGTPLCQVSPLDRRSSLPGGYGWA